jgi:hypothetical protein
MNTKASERNESKRHGGQIIKFAVATAVAALVAIGGLALLVNIMEHKQ